MILWSHELVRLEFILSLIIEIRGLLVFLNIVFLVVDIGFKRLN